MPLQQNNYKWNVTNFILRHTTIKINELLDILTNYSSFRLSNLFPGPNAVKLIIFRETRWVIHTVKPYNIKSVIHSVSLGSYSVCLFVTCVNSFR